MLSFTRETRDRWRDPWARKLRVEDGIDWPIADVLRDGGRVDLISDGSILGIRQAIAIYVRLNFAIESLMKSGFHAQVRR